MIIVGWSMFMSDLGTPMLISEADDCDALTAILIVRIYFIGIPH